MQFEYSNTIDKQCWKRLNVCVDIFGEKKKTDKYPVDSQSIKRFKKLWTPSVDKKFQKGMHKIFGVHFPQKFNCYLNSTPYSMDTDDGISISVSTPTPIRTICHEANHYLFRRTDYKRQFFPKINIENAKEIFTIVNNLYFQDIMESQDIGWKKFWKGRYNFLVKWIEIKKISISQKSCPQKA